VETHLKMNVVGFLKRTENSTPLRNIQSVLLYSWQICVSYL